MYRGIGSESIHHAALRRLPNAKTPRHVLTDNPLPSPAEPRPSR